MSLQVTGKNIKVGEAFQTYVSDKIDDAVEKYIGEYLNAHVRVEKERGRFFTNCSVRVRTGLLLESTGEGTDAYSSADAAFEHLEKRLRRYKRRLKNHHVSAEPPSEGFEGVEVNDFVVEVPSGASERKSVEDAPLIVAETARTLHSLTVSEAVMRLDLTEDAFLVFRNAGSDEVNVVYRRRDGNIGWIDPTSPAESGRADGAVSGGGGVQVGAERKGNSQKSSVRVAAAIRSKQNS